jgi:hypothetical protein
MVLGGTQGIRQVPYSQHSQPGHRARLVGAPQGVCAAKSRASVSLSASALERLWCHLEVRRDHPFPTRANQHANERTKRADPSSKQTRKQTNGPAKAFPSVAPARHRSGACRWRRGARVPFERTLGSSPPADLSASFPSARHTSHAHPARHAGPPHAARADRTALRCFGRLCSRRSARRT